MAIFLSESDSRDIDHTHAVPDERRLHDAQANAVWQQAIAWLARRMWHSRAYWLVMELCQQLTRLDYLASHLPHVQAHPSEPTVQQVARLAAVIEAHGTIDDCEVMAEMIIATRRYFDGTPERANAQRVVE